MLCFILIWSIDFVFVYSSFSFLISFISVPHPARELLRLQSLLKQKDQEIARGRLELEKKELEWRMRELPPNVGDQTGETTIHGGNLSRMDTSTFHREADELLSRSLSAGGSGGGSGDRQQQEKMPPPPSV